MGDVFPSFLLIALGLLLVSAGVQDARTREIANWKNAAIALLAPAWWWTNGLAPWPDMAIQFGALDQASGIPLPLVLGVLAGCALATMLAAHLAALSSARTAPLLPHEAKVHSRLVSEVRQIEAQRAVKERMTPRPASPRILAR